jgi:hypothetical protein
MRPRAWLTNFEQADLPLAALLLDHFTFYSDEFSDLLLKASFNAIADGLQKGPKAPAPKELLTSIENGCFTPVEGESPNPSDSGNSICRRARKLLHIPEPRIQPPQIALSEAASGRPVVFLDDFVGSGDQFLTTWNRSYSMIPPHSFADAFTKTGFTAIYVTLVATKRGVDRIHKSVPNLAISSAHVLDESATYRAITSDPAFPIANIRSRLDTMLVKYSNRLAPKDAYMDDIDRAFGYESGGLLFAFSDSVPDSTLPIFWSHGPSWIPLVERA